MRVARLTADDLRAFRDLHAYGLKQDPNALVESAEQDAARADADVAAMLARGDAWGVFLDDRLVGKFVMDAPPYAQLAHTRWLHAVYLHPDARGTGASDALMRAALTEAEAQNATRVLLWVNGRNSAARRYYERLGFVEMGRIDGGVVIDGEAVDDVLMGLNLPFRSAP
jgi:predicted GNAT family acetyltransferase